MPSAGAALLPPPMPVREIRLEDFPPPRPPEPVVSRGDTLPPPAPAVGFGREPLEVLQQDFGLYDRDAEAHGGPRILEVRGNIPPGAVLQNVAVTYDHYNGAMTVTATLTSNQIWTAWNTDHAITQLNTITASPITNATTTAITNVIWNAWNVAYTTGSATTASTLGAVTYTLNGRVWDAWNDGYTEITQLRNGLPASVVQQYSRRNLSEAELKAELGREKARREAAELATKKANEAKDRAEKILLACLSPQQQDDLQKKNSFYVEIPLGEGKFERYRIDRGSHGNVFQVDAKGSILRSFCIQPPGVPQADAMLAQKLFVEADEETRAKFWEIANIGERAADPKRQMPAHIPRRERYQYAKQNGLLH